VGKLFQREPEMPDTRPALMSIVALMVLLLPLVLFTTSAEKLTSIPLGVPGPTEELPPEPPGPVEGLRVTRDGGQYIVGAEVRNTDVLAGVGDTEHKEVVVPDLSALQAALSTFKKMDPARQRITLQPSPTMSTEDVVQWMDAVRSGPNGELFPRVILETVQ